MRLFFLFISMLVLAMLAMTSPALQGGEQEAVQTPVTTKPPQNEPPAPQSATKKENSLLESVGESIGSAIGLFSEEGRTEGQEGIPRRLAVLPAVGDGDDRERDDIRTVIYNNLSSKNFDLVKPFDVDLRLTQLFQSEGKKPSEYDPAELARKLEVEGLIFIEVPLVEKLYAAAYAHYKITIKLNFFSQPQNTFIWQKEETIAEREGGISLNPLSFIVQAISSAQVLTEAVRQTLVDKLARKFAAEIPFPIGQRNKVEPVQIKLALSNVASGPFRAGDEVTVVMQAENGLAATFDIGSKFVGLLLREQAEGEYVGRYVVNPNDNVKGSLVRINATRIKDRATIVWAVPGRIDMDTIPPKDIEKITSSPVQSAIKLTWSNATSGHETLTYHVERADPDTGSYAEVAASNIPEFTDYSVVQGNTYHYRVYAADDAGNTSAYANMEVTAVGVGPTRVEQDIITTERFYAIASPYIIDKPIRILRNAVLNLDPGVIIRFEDQGRLDILGQINAIGNEQSPIVFKGYQGWQMNFNNTGESDSKFSYTNITDGSLSLNQASVSIDNSDLRNMNPAISLTNASSLTLKQLNFQHNDKALWVQDGTIDIRNIRFIANKIAWQMDARQDFLATELTFDDNQQHIVASRPMTLKNAYFKNADYQEVLTRMAGEVTIDWRGLDDEDNLQKSWLEDRWQAVIALAQAGLWPQTLTAVREMATTMVNDKRVEGFEQAVRAVTGNSVDRPQGLAAAILQFEARNNQGTNSKGQGDKTANTTKGALWIQEIKLSYKANLVGADSYIISQAKQKFEGDYLAQRFPQLSPSELRTYKRKVSIKNEIIDSQVLYTSKKGLFLYVWLANYLDQPKIDRNLALAGLVQKANSEMTVGLLSQTEVYEFEELVIATLKKQNINYISLGAGKYGNPIQQKAERMGANIVLAMGVSVTENQSGLSENLKLADVKLILDLYDVYRNQSLEHLTGSDNSAGFNQREIVNKALVKAFAAMESNLLSVLWSADELVAEQIKAQRIAKVKAEEARKAEARERQKRQAKEQARKDEEARIAKAKQAAEAAAQQQAEQQRLAAAQAAAQKQAQLEAQQQAQAEQAAEQARLAAIQQQIALDREKASEVNSEANSEADSGKGSAGADDGKEPPPPSTPL